MIQVNLFLSLYDITLWRQMYVIKIWIMVASVI